MSACCNLWPPTQSSKGNTSRQGLNQIVVKVEPTPSAPSSNSQLRRNTPVRLQTKLSFSNRDRAKEEEADCGSRVSGDGAHLCQDRGSHVPDKATCLKSRAWGERDCILRNVLFNWKCRSTCRVNLPPAGSLLRNT